MVPRLGALSLLLLAAVLLPCTAACSGDDSAAGGSDLSGADLSRSDHSSADISATDLRSGDLQLSDAGSNVGACTNGSDQPIIDGKAKIDVDTAVANCARSTLTGGTPPSDPQFSDKIAACLATATGLSGGCTACWAANADCGADHCLFLCLGDSTTKDCVDCRCGRDGTPDCVGEFNRCSGLADPTCQ